MQKAPSAFTHSGFLPSTAAGKYGQKQSCDVIVAGLFVDIAQLCPGLPLSNTDTNCQHAVHMGYPREASVHTVYPFELIPQNVCSARPC
ncbi:hypothetical protein EYF80_005043 [Liparis tanakae]|uniref:Uncharacterized protein n=1 Tax=Liparis tanakae TaxID=230148 RepID=A0A4Z2J4L2_9TELE|nr:hypothetical protein EYF80_005043 [Liparis tanakae]